MHETIALSQRESAIVKEILFTYIPGKEVWAFGSRVTGKFKRYSDLDLLVRDEAPLLLADYGSLREAFSESDLPFRVDIIDWATTSESFRKIVEARYVVLQLSSH